MFSTETKIVVRYAETDQMGIVHHSNYAIWFEAARTDFIKQAGMPYSKIEEQGCMLPLIELNCSYKGVAKYEDELSVRTIIDEATPTRIKFLYEVYCKEKLISKGYTAHAWTNRQLKPINLKKHNPELLSLLSNNCI